MDLSKLARHPGLKGRSVFVTGGGSGIGAAIVEAFVDQGARVAFVDINAEVSNKLVADLKAQYDNAPLFIQCDLKDIPALQAAIAHAGKEHGDVQEAAGAFKTRSSSPDRRGACGAGEGWRRAGGRSRPTGS